MLCGGSGGKVGWSTIVQTIFVRNEDNGFENVLLQMTVLITDWGWLQQLEIQTNILGEINIFFFCFFIKLGLLIEV